MNNVLMEPLETPLTQPFQVPALTIDQALRYAAERHAAGFLQEAEVIYRQVLAQEPANAEAKNLLGRIAIDCGKLPEAAQVIAEAIRAAPQEPRYQVSWSLLCHERRAIGPGQSPLPDGRCNSRPAYAPAILHLGQVLGEQGDLAGAEAAYRAVIRVAPGLAVAHNDLGILLDQMGRKDEAISEFRAAVQLRAELRRRPMQPRAFAL